MAEQPKLDMKMLLLPALFFFSKKIDMKDPAIVDMLRAGFVSAVAIILTAYFYVYSQIKKKKDSKKIWVPPKPQPNLLGLTPPPKDGPKPEEYEATDYESYEAKLVKEAAQSIVLSFAVSMFMSYKFQIHMSLIMQGVMVPYTAISETTVFRKYVLGVNRTADGSEQLYNEVFTAPVAAPIEEITDAKVAEEKKKDAKKPTSSAGADLD